MFFLIINKMYGNLNFIWKFSTKHKILSIKTILNRLEGRSIEKLTLGSVSGCRKEEERCDLGVFQQNFWLLLAPHDQLQLEILSVLSQVDFHRDGIGEGSVESLRPQSVILSSGLKPIAFKASHCWTWENFWEEGLKKNKPSGREGVENINRRSLV